MDPPPRLQAKEEAAFQAAHLPEIYDEAFNPESASPPSSIPPPTDQNPPSKPAFRVKPEPQTVSSFVEQENNEHQNIEQDNRNVGPLSTHLPPRPDINPNAHDVPSNLAQRQPQVPQGQDPYHQLALNRAPSNLPLSSPPAQNSHVDRTSIPSSRLPHSSSPTPSYRPMASSQMLQQNHMVFSRGLQPPPHPGLSTGLAPVLNTAPHYAHAVSPFPDIVDCSPPTELMETMSSAVHDAFVAGWRACLRHQQKSCQQIVTNQPVLSTAAYIPVPIPVVCSNSMVKSSSQFPLVIKPPRASFIPPGQAVQPSDLNQNMLEPNRACPPRENIPSSPPVRQALLDPLRISSSAVALPSSQAPVQDTGQNISSRPIINRTSVPTACRPNAVAAKPVQGVHSVRKTAPSKPFAQVDAGRKQPQPSAAVPLVVVGTNVDQAKSRKRSAHSTPSEPSKKQANRNKKGKKKKRKTSNDTKALSVQEGAVVVQVGSRRRGSGQNGEKSASNGKERRRDLWNPKIELSEETMKTLLAKYALLIVERNATSGLPEWLACKFCALYGGFGRAKGFIKLYYSPFKLREIQKHLDIEHKVYWSTYSKENADGKLLYFRGKKLPDPSVFHRQVAVCKYSLAKDNM